MSTRQKSVRIPVAKLELIFQSLTKLKKGKKLGNRDRKELEDIIGALEEILKDSSDATAVVHLAYLPVILKFTAVCIDGIQSLFDSLM